MILVDSGVVIALLRNRQEPATAALRGFIASDTPFALAPIIVQEVLQGARDEAEWRRLLPYLTSQRLLVDAEPKATAVAAARIFFDCRRAGRTVRSSVDCAIAQLALQHGACLLQNDRDFAAIATVRPLQLLP